MNEEYEGVIQEGGRTLLKPALHHSYESPNTTFARELYDQMEKSGGIEEQFQLRAVSAYITGRLHRLLLHMSSEPRPAIGCLGLEDALGVPSSREPLIRRVEPVRFYFDKLRLDEHFETTPILDLEPTREGNVLADFHFKGIRAFDQPLFADLFRVYHNFNPDSFNFEYKPEMEDTVNPGVRVMPSTAALDALKDIRTVLRVYNGIDEIEKKNLRSSLQHAEYLTANHFSPEIRERSEEIYILGLARILGIKGSV